MSNRKAHAISDDTKQQNTDEIQQTGAAIEKLSQEPKAFASAYEAFLAGDADKFGAALASAGIESDCHLICRFFCKKRCIGVSRKFCPGHAAGEVDAAEVLGFARAVGHLLRDAAFVDRMYGFIESSNVEGWNQEIKRNKLEIYCYQLIVILCGERCEKRCSRVCPPNPLITRVATIPIVQIDAAGYGSGPSIPNFYVPAPNPAAGVGDHPFGGMVWLHGVFNMPSAAEYLVEMSTQPTTGFAPVLVGPQNGYNWISVFPFEVPVSRTQSTGPDPGWFKISEIPDSDGGPLTSGEKVLMLWPSPAPDGVYYLRLRVRDALLHTRVSSPQIVRIDNTGPFPLPKPTISLQLQKKDGTRVPLKCGKVRKDDGLIVVTIRAFDPNMSSVSVTARGNSGLSVPVVDVNSVPLSRTYNGNIADQGYTVDTEFLWDPWNDPRIVPCCYLIYVEVSDRAILNNSWTGGHYNAGWEALEIGF